MRSPQIEVEGQDSLVGRLVFRELETLWQAGHEFEDLGQWETEMEDMARRFGISSRRQRVLATRLRFYDQFVPERPAALR